MKSSKIFLLGTPTPWKDRNGNRIFVGQSVRKVSDENPLIEYRVYFSQSTFGFVINHQWLTDYDSEKYVISKEISNWNKFLGPIRFLFYLYKTINYKHKRN